MVTRTRFDELADALADEDVLIPNDGISPDELALMLYTSGTAAEPKGCLVTHDAAIHAWTSAAERLRITPDDRVWDPLPLFHMSCLGPLIFVTAMGGTLITMTHFTPAAALMTPSQLVNRLNRVFSEFDALALRLGVEKIKTIGDAYMAATGLPEPRPDHAAAIAQFGLGMLDTLHRVNGTDEDSPLRIRIGIHTGPAVAGVIGHHKFIYDVWGDTVNTASRLESHSLPGRVHVSEVVYERLRDRFEFEPRGVVEVKGKGPMTTYFLNAPAVVATG